MVFSRIHTFCRKLRLSLPLIVLGLSLATPVSSANADETFPSLISKVPATANALIAIDADGLRNSPLGKSENWSSKNEAAYVNTPFILPPEANRIVIASQMNPNRQFEQAWELAVMSLVEPISARAIARAEGGYVDELGGLSAVWSPSDAYFVQFTSGMLGVMAPANRQLVSRWAATSNPGLGKTGYLSESLNELSGGAQIVVALDLSGAAVPHQLKDGLEQAESLKGKADDIAKWENVLSSIQGVRLSITVDSKIHGNLTVDFGKDPAELGSKAKGAIVEVLEKYGVAFEDLNKWSFSQSQNSLHLNGDLSNSDLRKVMSLLELPSSNFSQLADAEPAAEDDAKKVVEASQKYFKSVSTLLDDLQHEFKTNRDARKNFASTYMQRYGKRINELPILNVDVELVDYGLSIAETLRGTAVTQGEANVNTGIRKSSVYTTNNYNNNYYGDYRSATSIKTQVKREEQGAASKVRFSNAKEIQDATANIRVKMTQRYNAEF